MIQLVWFLFWALLSALVVTAALKARARSREMIQRPTPRIDDDAVRAIVETGALSIEMDEPLDLREIDAEEQRFWSERWDEPEEM